MSRTINLPTKNAEKSVGFRWGDAYFGRDCWTVDIHEWFSDSGIDLPRVEIVFEKLFVREILLYNHKMNKRYSRIVSLRYDHADTMSYDTVIEEDTVRPADASVVKHAALHFSTETDALMFRMRWLQ